MEEMSVVIPDDVIAGYLDMLFGHSKPGQVLHHLALATAGRTALGLPDADPDQLKVAMFAIAPASPSEGEDPEAFVSRTILAALAQMRQKQAWVHFAGLAMEAYAVHDDGNEVTENRARLLRADGRLQDHAAAVEITFLYAASSDGRRWTGEHVLTGRRAGTVMGPALHTGGLAGPELKRSWQRLIRLAVGR